MKKSKIKKHKNVERTYKKTELLKKTIETIEIKLKS